MSINISTSNLQNSTSVAINSSLKNMFLGEGNNLLNSSKKCEELWAEMRKADFRKEGVLNEKNIQLVYEQKKNVINDLLKIQSSEEFVEVFDDDQDGFLDQDEQILVFTLIKERIQLIAEELCYLKEYDLYKDMMKEVRCIEALITKFQNELRQDVHKRQLDDYISIGVEMQNEFVNNWNLELDNYDKKTDEEIKGLEVNLKKINDLIYQKETNKIEGLKLKPSNKIRLLENQERLVAINERVEEADNFKKELKKAKIKDKMRLEKKKKEEINYLKLKLDKEERKEMKKKKDRVEKGKFNLIIEKNKESDVLSKQINLHIKDIERIQNSLSNMYVDKGNKNDELKRLKERQRNTNKVIGMFKSIKTNFASTNSNANKHDVALALLNIPSKNLSLNSSMEMTGSSKLNFMKKNIIALKYIIKTYNLTRFDINSDFNSRKFCNIDDDVNMKNDNNLKKKIRKLLDQRKHKDEILIPPTVFYDDNLNVVKNAKDYKQILPKIANHPVEHHGFDKNHHNNILQLI